MMVQVPEMPIFQTWVTHQIKADRLLAYFLFLHLISQGIILPLTHQARATVQLLKMNQPDRIQEREILTSAGIM